MVLALSARSTAVEGVGMPDIPATNSGRCCVPHPTSRPGSGEQEPNCLGKAFASFDNKHLLSRTSQQTSDIPSSRAFICLKP